MTEESKRIDAASEGEEAHRAHVSRIGSYLRRYPDLADEERTDLISGYRQLSNLDIAFMLSDPELAAKLQEFRVDHKRATRVPFRDYVVLLVLLVGGLAIVVYELLVRT